MKRLTKKEIAEGKRLFDERERMQRIHDSKDGVYCEDVENLFYANQELENWWWENIKKIFASLSHKEISQ